MQRNKFTWILICLFVFSPVGAFAQKAGTIERTEEQIDREKQLREKIETEKEAPQIQELPVPAPAPLAAEEKVKIQKINVTGATLVSQEEISGIIALFEGKELTIKEMQEVADLITEIYRKKGYVTSRAYLPPQKIRDGLLEIRIIEGITGNIQIRGNRFFRSALLKKYIFLDKGQPFNYNTLRNDLSSINEHPDRTVKAVLAPGKEPGTTDIILEVKDTLPLHASLGWDNYGSRYIRKNHYNSTISHNNLLGQDDIFSFQYQISDGRDYRLISLRYLYPVARSLKMGFSATNSKLDLGKEYKDLIARGKSRTYSLYGIYDLIRGQNVSLALNFGFDYKDSFNFQLNNEESRDRLRVGKIGFDLDVSDKWKGRTILSPEFDFGLARIMGGLKSVDPLHDSRAGSGGKFVKNTTSFMRLQQMPFASTLLWRNEFQISPYILPALEQFQIGGIANVRGYPSAEYVGDKGYSMSWEWSFPAYLIPKDFNIPFTQEKLYNAFRLAMFYDWGNVRLYRPAAGEEENKTLSSAGWGMRFNLAKNLSIRADFAWPLDGGTPTDGDHFHPWLQVTSSF